MNYKACRKCKKRKDVDKFHKQKTGKYGRRSVCIKCRTKPKKERFCKNCTKEITNNYVNSIYCSKKCKDAHWKSSNYEAYYDVNRRWKDNNVEHRLKVSRQQYARNPGRFIAKTVAYRESKRKAMPKWLTKKQLTQIKHMYENCPKGYHVDHIIPLNGANICGLHVPWNLQYLTQKENLRKGNRIPNR